ncbi:MAG: hypothetical protein M1833_005998 [Piccolia ochrophora]|nr:MAG: hypothetical protein M1833_005998 [Piccolia ochrophora]
MSNNTTIFEHGWVSSPQRRGTMDIIWGCFVTVFVCTWTILHLNLPAPDEGLWQILVRKSRWMVMAVIVPEVLTASAFAQRVAARESVRAMEAIDCPWTMRHAFYFNMGGVWLRPRDSESFPINAAQLNYLVADGYMNLPSITEQEIWDKSKVDTFAKIVACGHIGWLLLQCIGRAAQHQPITPLEIASIGFAIPSLATYILWFHKPANVEVPIYLDVKDTTTEMLKRLNPQIGYQWHHTPLDFISTVNSPSFTSEVILKTQRWPGREAFLGPSTRIRNDVFALKYRKLDQVIVSAVWIGYSCVHISAWNFSFPSYVELILWRVASLAMIGSMFIFWITSNRKSYLLVAYLWPTKRKRMQEISNERANVSALQIVMGAISGVIYLLARLCLIVQVFLCLRKTPTGAFNTVEWGNFLPHI